MGTRVVGRAPRATETTGREAVAVLEADFAARLAAGRRGRRRRRLGVLVGVDCAGKCALGALSAFLIGELRQAREPPGAPRTVLVQVPP